MTTPNSSVSGLTDEIYLTDIEKRSIVDVLEEYRLKRVKVEKLLKVIRGNKAKGNAKDSRTSRFHFTELVGDIKQISLDVMDLHRKAREIAQHPDSASPENLHKPELHDSFVDSVYDQISLSEIEVSIFQSLNPIVQGLEIDEMSSSTSLMARLMDTLLKDRCLIEDKLESIAAEMKLLPPPLDIKDQMVRLVDLREKFNLMLNECHELEPKFYKIHDKWRREKIPQVETLQRAIDVHHHKMALLMTNRPLVKLVPQKLPVFSGDVLDYLEFKTGWANLMKEQRLVESQEVFYLKDALPANVKIKLHQLEKLDAIWAVLDLEFGNVQLMIQLLKGKLRSIKTSEKDPAEAFIQVHDQMTYLVNRLMTVGAGLLLTLEKDYLTAIYVALPAGYKTKWDDFVQDTFSDEWSAFMNFMNLQYKSALKKRILSLSIKTQAISLGPEPRAPVVTSCKSCGKIGHTEKTCRVTSKFHATTGHELSSVKGKLGKKSQVVLPSSPKSKRQLTPGVGSFTCILCTRGHTFLARSGSNGPSERDSDRVSNCPLFRDMSPNERAKYVLKEKCCYRCTSWNHEAKDCRLTERQCGRPQEQGGPCTSFHSAWLHGESSVKFNHTILRQENEVLLSLQEHSFGSGIKGNILWDSGSTHNLITHRLARSLELTGVPVFQWVQVTGEPPKLHETLEYKVRLIQRNGVGNVIKCFGMEDISGEFSAVNVRKIAHLFPEVPYGALDRPSGPIDLLIGVHETKISPIGGRIVGNLRVEHSLFGTGWILSGHHTLIMIAGNPQVDQSEEGSDVASYHFSSCVAEPNSLEVAKDLVAEAGAHISDSVANKISKDCYVDDGLSGADTTREAYAMIGKESKHPDGSSKYSGLVSQILELGGLGVKVMFSSLRRKKDTPEEENVTSLVGHKWNHALDLLSFKFKVNLSHKAKGISSEALSTTDLVTLTGSVFTPRLCLRIVNSCYDPAGLCSPFLAKIKILLRTTTKLGKDWDEELPAKLQEEWRNNTRELLQLEEITFPRSVNPYQSAGPPILVGFFDGSMEAYSAKIYCRWRVRNQVPEARLLTAKIRVVPAKGLTIPRTELNGLLILSRLLDTSIRAMRDKPSQVYLYGDSACIIAALRSRTTILAPYFQNRIAEITDLHERWRALGIQVHPVRWICGSDNPADLGTRPNVTAKQVGPGSLHQDGPFWLALEVCVWPDDEPGGEMNVPDDEVRKGMSTFNLAMVTREDRYAANHFIRSMKTGRFPMFNYLQTLEPDYLVPAYDWLAKYSRWQPARRTAARIARCYAWMSSRGLSLEHPVKSSARIADPLELEDFIRGDRYMLLLAMKHTIVLMKTKKLTGLSTFVEDGVVYTKGRLGGSMLPILGKERLAVLAADSHLARLIMTDSHCQDHRREASDAVFRSRKHAWIVKAVGLAKLIIRHCFGCKILKSYISSHGCQQRMGDLPPSRTLASKPFLHITLDFFGPYLVRGLGNSRVKVKVFPITICCQSTGAISIKVCNGYSTAALMEQMEIHVCERGKPLTIYSDLGSQLVRAAKESNSLPPSDEDWSKIIEQGAQEGTRWSFAPAQAQHRDGLSESRVKAIKHSLDHLRPGTALNYVQFQVLMSKIAYLVNERPLAVTKKNDSQGEPVVLTPNMILLGHSGRVKSTDVSDVSTSKYLRSLAVVDKVEAEWWNLFRCQVFHSLLPYPKWSQLHRNLQINDVCILRGDKSLDVMKADYRLCKIVKRKLDKYGVVRTVVVTLARRDTRVSRSSLLPPKMKEMTVAIQRLVLIHPADMDEGPPDDLDLGEDEAAGPLSPAQG